MKTVHYDLTVTYPDDADDIIDEVADGVYRDLERAIGDGALTVSSPIDEYSLDSIVMDDEKGYTENPVLQKHLTKLFKGKYPTLSDEAIEAIVYETISAGVLPVTGFLDAAMGPPSGVCMLTVKVDAIGTPEGLDPEDRNVAGVYRFKYMGDQVPVVAAANVTLDAFHSEVPIKFPEHFEITVHDLNGHEVTPSAQEGVCGAALLLS